jgi:hypothetical protein
MDEPLKLPPPEPEGAARAPAARVIAMARRGLLRQLGALLGASVAAFALTTWWLVRQENSPEWFAAGSEPAGVVREQLAALRRGELRAAYEMFSERYRREVPFEAFQELVVTHRAMFHTRVVRFRNGEQAPDRAVLNTDIVSADGSRYVARFTLLRARGHWWIDDVRWAVESRGGRFVKV